MKKQYRVRRNPDGFFELNAFIIGTIVMGVLFLNTPAWSKHHVLIGWLIIGIGSAIYLPSLLCGRYLGMFNRITVNEKGIRQKIKGTEYFWEWTDFDNCHFVHYVVGIGYMVGPNCLIELSSRKNSIQSFSIVLTPAKLNKFLAYCSNEELEQKIRKVFEDN